MKFIISVAIVAMPDLTKPSGPFTALAFDFGLKKIGVAVGESLTQTAKPLTILKSVDNKPDYSQIEKIIKEWRPKIIVVGIPYNPHSSSTPSDSGQQIINLAQKFANKITHNFQKTYQFELHTVNEEFTSIEAKKIFVELRKNKLIKQGAKLDDIAACIILERWFCK